MSLQRIAYLMKMRESKSGLFEKLEDLRNLSSPVSSFQGIRVDGSSVILRFVEPVPNLLSQIGFGLYAIAHPDDFDHQTGEWRSGRSAISSGPYTVLEWDEDDIVLNLRDDYDMFPTHKNPFRRIEISSRPDIEDAGEVDVFLLASDRYIDGDHLFYGPVQSNIRYVLCKNLDRPGNPLVSKELRQLLRAAFYRHIEKSEGKIVRSFFPLGIRGVNEFRDPILGPSGEALKKEDVLRYPEFPVSLDAISKRNKLQLGKVFSQSFEAAAKDLGLNAEKIAFDFKKHHSYSPEFDIGFLGTGVRVEMPEDDIRFMFESKEGIRLPDETGEILKLIRQKEFDVQEVNRLLWDQAIVWPFNHYSSGLWVRPHVDMSGINTAKPPTAFQWIGLKE